MTYQRNMSLVSSLCSVCRGYLPRSRTSRTKGWIAWSRPYRYTPMIKTGYENGHDRPLHHLGPLRPVDLLQFCPGFPEEADRAEDRAAARLSDSGDDAVCTTGRLATLDRLPHETAALRGDIAACSPAARRASRRCLRVLACHRKALPGLPVGRMGSRTSGSTSRARRGRASFVSTSRDGEFRRFCTPCRPEG